MGFFERRVVRALGRDDLPSYPAAGDDAGIYPALVEFLTRDRFEDNEIRVRGNLLVFVEGGRLKGCLTDKAQAMVGFVAVESLDVMLGAIDVAIRDSKVDWRKQRGTRGER